MNEKWKRERIEAIKIRDERICPKCKEEMIEQTDIGYDYKTFKYLECLNCGYEKYE